MGILDFPAWFNRARQLPPVSARNFRGMAGVATPLSDVTPNEQIVPISAEIFTDYDTPAHFIVKPMKTIHAAPSTTTGTVILPKKPGIRYYIHTAAITARLIAGDTTDIIVLSVVCGGTTTYPVYLNTVPSVAAAYNPSASVLDILTDENTDVIGLVGTAQPAQSNISISYSEIGAGL